ncbi:MAG: DUF2231 domain-containing protein [Gaiellales bacterium]
MSEIQGLPSHPLLVHGPVVLVPLLALLALAMVVRRSWRVSLGPWVVLLGVVMLGMTAIAAGSGEDLQANVRNTDLVRHHAELGSAMRPIAFALFVAIVLLVAPAWAYARGGPGMLARLAESSAWNVVIVVLVVVTSVLATYWIIQTGHSGADAVWHNVKIVKSGEG